MVFEQSGHMTFVEENAKFVDAVDAFLRRTGTDRAARSVPPTEHGD